MFYKAIMFILIMLCCNCQSSKLRKASQTSYPIKIDLNMDKYDCWGLPVNTTSRSSLQYCVKEGKALIDTLKDIGDIGVLSLILDDKIIKMKLEGEKENYKRTICTARILRS